MNATKYANGIRRKPPSGERRNDQMQPNPTCPLSSYSWMDDLEKEFDKAFVDLDLILGEVDDDKPHDQFSFEKQHKLAKLSATFAQLIHKVQSVSQSNAWLEVRVSSRFLHY